jgi:predicted naringenin-chalcone synthase
MPAYINHISTAVPEHWYDQQYVMNFMKKHVAKDRMTSMILHRFYTQSGIQKRHSVLEEFDEGKARGLFVDPHSGALRSPTTGERNALYTQEARKLFIAAARQVFEDRPEIASDLVTHVITVSCTGFYAPGPDLDIVKALSLPSTTQRLHVGFMGCYAAMPALRTAQTIVTSDPDAVVLVVAAELCTLHLKFEDDTDSLLSTTVFADGCAAALVSGRRDFSPQPSNRKTRIDPADWHHDELMDEGEANSRGAGVDPESTNGRPTVAASTTNAPLTGENGLKPGLHDTSTEATGPKQKPVLRLDGLFTAVTPNGAEHMAWTIGDHGFDMVLTSYIPDLISSNLHGVLQPIWDQSGLEPNDIDLWAVHPGGRAIVDKVQQQLELQDFQVEASRQVLRDYGNMSSATVLFVLKRLMDQSAEGENAVLVEAEGSSQRQTRAATARTSSSEAVSENSVISSVEGNTSGVDSSAGDGFGDGHSMPAPGLTDGRPKQVLAMAFGPGLTVETALLTLNP